ncbi:MAG: NADH-quinone oxidoreductase subunit E [Actinobacteria bacterium]|jgi:NADH-quinone oxidoreductase subunit E|nr:NADH-quinone oxidoreductase subunit E [Actinomycetota bacterium]
MADISSNGTTKVLVGGHYQVAKSIVSKYPNSRSAVLPLLFLVQGIEGHVTDQGMRDVAGILGLTPAEVLASGSFYTMLKKKPTGEYLISVCRNVSCAHRGAHKVINALSERLDIDPGAVTADGRFELETAECLATCDGAPSMQINYEDFYNLTPESAVDLVDRIERGETVAGERGETVRTQREVSYETAVAGARLPGTAGDIEARTVGGESPPEDMKAGDRPKLRDDEGTHGG